jgi:hypothetical protein
VYVAIGQKARLLPTLLTNFVKAVQWNTRSLSYGKRQRDSATLVIPCSLHRAALAENFMYKGQGTWLFMMICPSKSLSLRRLSCSVVHQVVKHIQRRILLTLAFARNGLRSEWWTRRRSMTALPIIETRWWRRFTFTRQRNSFRLPMVKSSCPLTSSANWDIRPAINPGILQYPVLVPQRKSKPQGNKLW